MSNSNNDLEPNNIKQNNETETTSTEKKTISDRVQYLIGALSGLVTGAAIYVTGIDLGIQDQLINKFVDYAFLVVFALFLIFTRKYENDNNVSLKKTKTAYMLAMGLTIAVFLFMAITTPK